MPKFASRLVFKLAHTRLKIPFQDQNCCFRAVIKYSIALIASWSAVFRLASKWPPYAKVCVFLVLDSANIHNACLRATSPSTYANFFFVSSAGI